MSIDEARDAVNAATAYMKEPWADTTRHGLALACIVQAIEALIDAKLSPAPVGDDETMASCGRWADETFGPATPLRRIERAEEEIEEAKIAPPDKLLEEIADAVICLAAAAHSAGGDLQAAINAKMAINRKRQWSVRGDGTGYHIAAPTPPAKDTEGEDKLMARITAVATPHRIVMVDLETTGELVEIARDAGGRIADLEARLAEAERRSRKSGEHAELIEAQWTAAHERAIAAERALADATKRIEAAADELIQVSANSGSMKMPEARAHVLAALIALVPNHPLLSPASEGKTDG